MNREEKAQGSKERILSAAVEVFSEKSFDSASLNTICNSNDISKGLLYHYFGGKDDIYLCCVKVCFEKFTEFMSGMTYDFSDVQHGMRQYLERRLLFFCTYPQEGRMFFRTLLQPPSHLKEKLLELHVALEHQGLAYYKAALAHITLREDVTHNDALEYFVLFQELFNGYVQRHMGDGVAFEAMMQAHEGQLAKILDMMLYGIAREKIK